MRDSSCKLHEVCDMMTGGTTYLSNLEDICGGTRGGITLGVQVAEVVGIERPCKARVAMLIADVSLYIFEAL